MSSVVLFSSANKQGNTAQVVQALAQQVSLKVINLDELSITPYNYANQYPQDDFYPLVETLLSADNIIFASPIYWHCPTAQMKAFMDRMTELLDVSHLKPKARALANKRGFIISSSAQAEVCPIFESIFAKMYRYYDMSYQGNLHGDFSSGQANIDSNALLKFAQQLDAAKRPCNNATSITSI
ncbi:NAD(P)H-dependent oxidoreductase [Vibrio scophthalmi]|uniref:NADPH-dependent FMN reductase-like domain-containing protein n=1 Tax=Vibrio scophthalmi TaxID=45658 RepID=A0A1C7FHJ8_9VIBR|nr:NAD(P)H-dependent oxidoreductase [Vibrio scophthalmi]ANU38933.1 hypothetical protein VSVS05_03897 [Vibrio scophthalmi]